MAEAGIVGGSDRTSTRVTSRRWVPGWGLGPILFALAAWFLVGAGHEAIPRAPTPRFDESALSLEPRRKPLADPPRISVNGFERTCMDCHRLFLTPTDQPRQLHQHQGVELAHGPNVKCSTCHDWQDRDRLISSAGTPIGYDDVVALCASCHASKHQDWTRGMHGRTNGFWLAERGPQTRLGCTACHDPHRPAHPAMAPLEPLPGPHTLRMRSGEHH